MSEEENELPYDPSDRDSIIGYAQRLVGTTLRDHIEVEEIQDPHVRRGSFGNAVEEYYFKYDINSDQNPDFAEVGLELKTTPLRRGKNNTLVSKERLVLTMIDYMTVVNEDFEHSHLLNKVNDVLLISYLWEPDKSPLDYTIELASDWQIPEEDIPQIKQDWNIVVEKVRAGHAEDISGSDTMYLEACTKAANSKVRRKQPYSDIEAKPRAWALKASYMTAVTQGLLKKMEGIKREKDEAGLSLLDLVRRRFEPFFGCSEDELKARYGLTKSKDIAARITKQILGVDEGSQIAEFEKAGIKAKTIRLQANGRPKEAMSFPCFDYFNLAERNFEDSDFFGYLQQKYLFVIYRADDEGIFRLADICFWQMPDADYPEAKRCFDQMKNNVLEGRADVNVRSTENRCCHVRPHGRNSADTWPQPYGDPVVKKSFWLNQSYLAEQIAKALQSGR